MSYRHWAEELAESIAPQLDAERRVADFKRALRSDESPDSLRERTAAVNELGILHHDGSWRFDGLIALACGTFGVGSATVSVIDADRLVHKAERGNVPQRIMLDASFSAAVIREADGMIVPDATVDPRFRDLPHVFGPPRIRFYAGFALEAPNGTRIGTLNIFDPAPRFSNETWRPLRLRQFGLMVQAELHRGGK
jgi:GAF domain-containing protein